MNYLNINKRESEQINSELNILLSDLHLYYQKLRNFHWNVSGSNFFELHAKFEDLYNDARVKIDDIAERVLTLGGKPFGKYKSYLEHSNLSEPTGVMTDLQMVEAIITDLSVMTKTMRKILMIASEISDEGTIDLLGSYIREFEKSAWMLTTWTNMKLTRVENLENALV